MTLDQLIFELQRARRDDEAGAMPVVLTPMGGLSCHSTKITGWIYGFDWHFGKIVLQTDSVLEYHRTKAERCRGCRQLGYDS